MFKFTIGATIATLFILALGHWNGYRFETMQAKDLPGFTQSKIYLVQGGIEPRYGFKFYVKDDQGNHRILSPWHFGYDYQ
jgi:hypothetical protein